MIGTVWLNGFFQEYFLWLWESFVWSTTIHYWQWKFYLNTACGKWGNVFGSNGKNKQILDLNKLFWFITIQKFFVKNVGHYLKDLNIVIILTL